MSGRGAPGTTLAAGAPHAGGLLAAAVAGVLGIAVLATGTGGSAARPEPLAGIPAWRAELEEATVSRAATRAPIDIGALRELRLRLEPGDGTWTVDGTEVRLDMYRLVPGEALTYTADLVLRTDRPVTAALSGRTATGGSALVTGVAIAAEGAALREAGAVVELDADHPTTVRVTMDVVLAAGTDGQALQDATFTLPDVTVRVQPAATGLIEGVVRVDGVPAGGVAVSLEAAAPGGAFTPVADPLLIDGRSAMVVTGADGRFGWPVVDGTYRVTAQSMGSRGSSVVHVAGSVAEPLLALSSSGDLSGPPPGERADGAGPGGPGEGDGAAGDPLVSSAPLTGPTPGEEPVGEEASSSAPAPTVRPAPGGADAPDGDRAPRPLGARGPGAVEQPGITLVLASLVVGLVLALRRGRWRRVTLASPSPGEGDGGTFITSSSAGRVRGRSGPGEVRSGEPATRGATSVPDERRSER